MMRPTTVLAALALLGLAACSTEGKVTPLTSSADARMPKASVWSLSVHGCEEASECEELRFAVVSRLVGASMAEQIVTPGQPAQLGLDIAITRTRAVPGAVRVLFGAMAGRNEVDATATLRDLRGAAPSALRSFKVESGSAAHPFSGQSGVQDAYRQFSNDVVAGLRG